ncbi:hypothetical protein V6N12_007513 [Hibiscus sabdariffa]|uniref:Uncharacterized protein n=1 Tax=Hibiscus sabdariffa TaxID=183260 RepID=A0ABR2F203_9ROSI
MPTSHNATVDKPRKRKADLPVPVDQTQTLDLSTSIDTDELKVLSPTKSHPARPAKRQRTDGRRQHIITSDSDTDSSQSPAF